MKIRAARRSPQNTTTLSRDRRIMMALVTRQHRQHMLQSPSIMFHLFLETGASPCRYSIHVPPVGPFRRAAGSRRFFFQQLDCPRSLFNARPASWLFENPLASHPATTSELTARLNRRAPPHHRCIRVEPNRWAFDVPRACMQSTQRTFSCLDGMSCVCRADKRRHI